MADHEIGGDAENVHNSDADQLQRLGFKQQFIRTIGALDSFASSFCAVNFVGSTRLTFFLGILTGGPLAMWSSFLINGVTVCLSSAILAEICSAIPINGSIYIWAAAAAGVKYGRFVGFIVAWWTATAWATFVAVTSEGVALYILSLITVFDLPFPGGVSNDNVRWRALLWIVSEGVLLLSAAITYLPPRWYSMVFRGAMAVILFDFFLCLVWLPIGASRTYGLRTASEALLTTYNGTGATPGWNWMLSFFFTSSILVGFDAAGHVAEETKDARSVAGRSILRSAIATSIGAFATIILFLFCTPSIEALFSLSAPQPFVLIYSMALGRGGAVVMALIAALGATSSISILILAASRIIFAIARDGTLPLSSWVGEVTPDRRPQNAMLVTYGACAILLCPIIGSSAAFTSLMSGGVVPLIATYGLIALLRLTVTPNEFRDTEFSLGKARKILYGISALANAVIVMALVSPFTFPVTAVNMNFGGIIFGVITIFGIISYWLTPKDRWLPQEKIQKMIEGASQLSDRQELDVTELLDPSNEASDSKDKK